MIKRLLISKNTYLISSPKALSRGKFSLLPSYFFILISLFGMGNALGQESLPANSTGITFGNGGTGSFTGSSGGWSWVVNNANSGTNDAAFTTVQSTVGSTGHRIQVFTTGADRLSFNISSATSANNGGISVYNSTSTSSWGTAIYTLTAAQVNSLGYHYVPLDPLKPYVLISRTTAGTGRFELNNIYLLGNDNCTNASNLTVGATAVSGTLNGAGQESPFVDDFCYWAGYCGGDVWYKFTASCNGNYTVNLTGLSGDEDVFVYSTCGTSSYFASGESSSTSTESVSFSGSTGSTYYIQVYDYGENGGSFNVTLTGPANAAVTSVSGTSPLCAGASAVTYTANGVTLSGGTGAWSSSNTAVATVNSSGSVTPVGAGTCNIIYTITGGCGGIVSAQQSLTVNNGATISYSGSPFTYCTGNEITNLTPTVTGVPTSYSISPSLPTGLSFNTSTGVISGTPTTVSDAANYTVTVNAGSCSNNTTISVTTKVGPTSVNAGYDVALCSGSSTELNGSASNLTTTLLSCDMSNVTGWTVSNSTYVFVNASNYAGGTADEAAFDYTLFSTNQDLRLNSPQIIAAGYENLSLTFKHFLDWYANTCGPISVQTSTDNITWTDRWTLTPTENVGPTTETVDLSALNNQNFYLRWRYNGDTYNYDGWFVDDIVVTGKRIISYSWSPATFLSATNTSNPTASNVTSNTTYTMTATSNGCSVTDQVAVTIRTIPAATASNSGPVCSGSTANLTATNMAPSGKGINFSGTQTTSGALLGSANTFTMELWVNPTTTRPTTSQQNGVNDISGTSGQRYAVNPAHGSTNAGAGISVGTNGVSVFEHGAGYLPSLLVHDVAISGWTHIAVVYTNKTPSLYINGNLVKVGLTSQQTNVYPSVGVGSGYGYYEGAIDNFRVWSVARTASEILANMNLEAPTSTTGLVARYDFNDNTNATVGSNLTNFGGTYSTPNIYTYTWSGTSAPAAATTESQSLGTVTTTGNYTVVASTATCAGNSSSATTLTVNQPNTTTIDVDVSANDSYVWSGSTSSTWGTASNWYKFDGTNWVVPASAPGASDKVFILDDNGQTCIAANDPSASGTISSLWLKSGTSLSLSSTLTVDDFNNNGGTINLSSNTLDVKGNFTNNGTLTEGTGTVSLTGSSAQTVAGSDLTFYNLTVNNSNGITLANIGSVSGNLNLTNGVVNLGNNNLTIGNSGSISVTSPSSSRMINTSGTGELRKHYTQGSGQNPAAFLFPIGTTGEYSPVQLDFTSVDFGADAYVRVRVEAARNANMSASQSSYLDRNWIVEPNDISNFTYNIKYKYVESDFVDGGLTVDEIVPIKYSSSQWYQPDGLVTPFPNAVNESSDYFSFGTQNEPSFGETLWLAWDGLQSFSEFGGAGQTGQPLPVELVSFSGACDEGIISLTWQTASEFNSSHFEVEKSRDGENWQTLSIIPSAGTSNQLITYQSTDQNGTDGNNYFRLRQVDIDGTEKLYDPINVSCSDHSAQLFTTYPNPSNNTFQVIINNKDLVGECTLNIIDAQGKFIEQRKIEVKEGINMFVINQDMNPGIYFINITNGNNSTPNLRHAIK